MRAFQSLVCQVMLTDLDASGDALPKAGMLMQYLGLLDLLGHPGHFFEG